MIRALILAFLLPVFCKGQSIEKLDIKNGFLQFHLGDSISNYKEIINKPDKISPEKYEVKRKSISLKHYIGKITLITENGIVTAIAVSIDGEANERFIDDAMKKSYGEPTEITDNAKKWIGKRVSLLANKISFWVNYSGKNYTAANETLVIRKISDIKIVGELGSDFLL